MQILIEDLEKAHNRKAFDCGDEDLNKFLREQARKASSRHISRTRVLVGDNNKVMGYYTVTFINVEAPIDSPYSNYPHPLPALLVARLAIDKVYQRQGLGEYLLIDALIRARQAVSISAPIIGAFVDVKNEAAARFYTTLGFLPIDATTKNRRMWLPMKTIETLAEGS